MRVIAYSVLKKFGEKHADARLPLNGWYRQVKKTNWKTPQDVKRYDPKVSITGDNRVVFDICGGNYRLVVYIHYAKGLVLIKFIGTHADYDQIDAKTVQCPV